MSENKGTTINLRDALDKHLNARSLTKSISTLLKSKRKTIDFRPYYQRNYVWDNHKATFFIESILLGVEIPPLIMFIPSSNKRKYEVIDGRQRFETLKRFYEGDFKLSKAGLRSLGGLKGLNFQSLRPEIQRAFSDTTIRIIEFSTIGDHPNQEYLEDRIKKEIFWRYNSGITPLKTLEVQRAKHLDDDFTAIMESKFKSDSEWLEQFKEVFFAKPIAREIDDAECQAKIRELLVLEHFPINIYASTSSRRDTVEWLYELYIEGAEDQIDIFESFQQKTIYLYRLRKLLGETEWIIYQGVYWALVILEQNDIDLERCLDQKTIKKLSDEIKNNIDIFTSDERGFATVTKSRFKLLADFFNQRILDEQLGIVDFSIYLNSKINVRKNSSSSDVDRTISELNSMRLNRPDAVTKTIEDLTGDMSSSTFLIRPSYQRKEVINIKKASGIIESMLLGIPLPTIFVYRRNDSSSTCEVVDGQQRLLSILAFLGEPYKNNNNLEVRSKKNNYKLFNKMNVLKELGGSRYDDLAPEWQDRLWDFELSVVYIDEKLNTEFDPIDLFIRLNNKPYPVKDHSFEMWNSYSEKRLIEEIRSLNRRYASWFYYRKDNRRMDNEELLTIFSYLTCQSRRNIEKVFETVDIYNWAPRPLTFRVPKLLITEWFRTAEGDQNIDKQSEILECINGVESFILKVEILTESLGTVGSNDNESLNQMFNKLLGLRGQVRRQKGFYMLWFLLLGIDHKVLQEDAQTIANDVTLFISDNNDMEETNNQPVKVIFRHKIQDFWRKYSSNN